MGPCYTTKGTQESMARLTEVGSPGPRQRIFGPGLEDKSNVDVPLPWIVKHRAFHRLGRSTHPARFISSS